MKKKNIYLVATFSKVLIILLSFINSILLNRYLGPELKGQYAYILNISNILTIIISFNLVSGYPFFKNKYGKEVKEKYIKIIYFQLMLYMLIFFILFKILVSNSFLYIALLSLLFQFNNQLDFISITEDIVRRNKIIMLSSFIYTSVLIIFFLIDKEKLYLPLYLLIVTTIFKSILYIVNFSLIPRKNSKSSLKIVEMLKFSILPLGTALLSTFNYNIDIIILEKYVSFEQIGIYSVGVTLASMLWIVPDSFKEILINRISSNNSIDEVVLSIKINLYFCMISVFTFFLMGQEFINVVYGSSYSKSFSISLILILGTIPMIFFKMINTYLLIRGRQKEGFILLVISVFLNVIGNIIVIPSFGIIGAAFTSVLSYILCGFVLLLLFINEHNLRLKDFLKLNQKEIKKIKKLFERGRIFLLELFPK